MKKIFITFSFILVCYGKSESQQFLVNDFQLSDTVVYPCGALQVTKNDSDFFCVWNSYDNLVGQWLDKDFNKKGQNLLIRDRYAYGFPVSHQIVLGVADTAFIFYRAGSYEIKGNYIYLGSGSVGDEITVTVDDNYPTPEFAFFDPSNLYCVLYTEGTGNGKKILIKKYDAKGNEKTNILLNFSQVGDFDLQYKCFINHDNELVLTGYDGSSYKAVRFSMDGEYQGIMGEYIISSNIFLPTGRIIETGLQQYPSEALIVIEYNAQGEVIKEIIVSDKANFYYSRIISGYDASGNFAIAWEDGRSEYHQNLYIQLFNSTISRVGGEFLMTSDTTGFQWFDYNMELKIWNNKVYTFWMNGNTDQFYYANVLDWKAPPIDEPDMIYYNSEKSAYHRVYPNPSAGPVTVEFKPVRENSVSIYISDLMGRKIKLLFEGTITHSGCRIIWDASHSDGTKVSPGVYLYIIETTEECYTGKIIFTNE